MSVYPRTITGKDGKKSEYWYVEVKGPNGKIKRSVGKKGLVTKAEARRIEQEMKRQIRLGQWGMVQTEPTFDTFAPEFVGYLRDVKQNRSWKHAEESIKNFAKVFGTKKLSEITSADIEDYKRLKSHEGKKPLLRRLFSSLFCCCLTWIPISSIAVLCYPFKFLLYLIFVLHHL
ncbi:MAG TPA: hypothetical protein VHT73_12950, partial [Thermodesulfobacteriota bacterium]|nr:hypothetical protein [Thermodesulfobacteriota bacterium]